MTSKKDALVNELARLAARHSSGDWLYAAEALEKIAQVARGLAEKAGTIEQPKRRARATSTRLADRPKLSLLTRKFADYLTREIGTRSGPNLRELANFLGMKSDLPRGVAAIVEDICWHLEKLPAKDRAKKIRGAVSFVENLSPGQSDHYERWVSLITKKRPGSVE